MEMKDFISRFNFRSKSVLDHLQKGDLPLQKDDFTLNKVRKGKELFLEGSFPKRIYIIKRGKVKLFQRDPDGGEQIVYIYSSGEMFGYRPLLCEGAHPASAVAIEDSSIYYLSIDRFKSALGQSALLSNILLQNLSHEFTVLVNRIAVFGQRTTRERLALSLLILREKYRKPDGQYGEISLSRADLAAFVGTTIETVARLVTRFRQDNIIRLVGRKIAVTDPHALMDLADCMTFDHKGSNQEALN